MEDDAAANPVSHTYPSPSNVWKFSLISDQDLHKQINLISRKGISSKFVFVPAYTAEEFCAEFIPASQMREFAASEQTVHTSFMCFVRKVQLYPKKSRICWLSSMLISPEMAKNPNKVGNTIQLLTSQSLCSFKKHKRKEMFMAYSLSALE